MLTRKSILFKTNALMGFITAAACVVAAVQFWLGYQVSTESQQIKSFELPVAVRSMAMRGSLGDLHTSLLEYTLGDAKEKAEYYRHLAAFNYNRSNIPTDQNINAKLDQLDLLVNQLQQDAEQRIFGVYDPKKEQQARRNIGRLQEDVGKPLQTLLDSMKSEEVADAAAYAADGGIQLDDFQGMELYLELYNAASSMISDLDRFVLSDLTARRAFFQSSLEFEMLLEQLRPLETKPTEVVRIREIQRLFKELKSGGMAVFALYRTTDYADAVRVIEELYEAGNLETLKVLENVAEDSGKAVQARISDLGDLAVRSNIIMLSCLAIAIGLLLFGTMFIRRRVIVPLGSITHIIGKLREGERTIDIVKLKQDDEISQILNALREFQSELHELDLLRERQIAQYKELESRELLLQNKSAALEAANKDLEQFVHIASHDLREPLKQISGFSELLELQTEGSLDAEAAESVQHIQRYSVRMCDLIDDLRALTTVSGSELVVEACDLKALLDTVLKDNEAKLQSSGARLTIGYLPVVDCNPSLMRQVFENLLMNALHHGKSPLKIIVQATSELDEYSQGVSTIEFSNTSSVIGTDLKRLTLPFVRDNKESAEGTGMGLTICKKIVEVHEGTLSITQSKDYFNVHIRMHNHHRGRLARRASYAEHSDVNDEPPLQATGT